MASWPRKRLGAFALAAACLAGTGAVYAATATFTAPSKVVSARQAVATPCTGLSTSFSPVYDTTEGSYVVSSVTLEGTCDAGSYRFSVTIGAGGTNYTERSQMATLQTTGAMSLTFTFPTPVRAADVSNVAVLVMSQ